ncbi:hypothetical protein [Rubritalea tangerina]|uniref:hypothetical protein n=1 Tax=Rubritalea tangerina TaxID=430798 RepID=UPI0036175B39
MSSLSFSCPARGGLLHSDLIYCKLILSVRLFRIIQWYHTNSQNFLVVFMIVRLWIGLRHRLGVSAAFAFSLRYSSVMVHAPLLSHSLRNGKISLKILAEIFAHWY